jgi:L,D-transpeptidase YbiS
MSQIIIPDSLERYIEISIPKQQLDYYQQYKLTKTYSISSAKLGAGNLHNSWKTPLGWHTVRAKIGDKQLLGSVFVARRATGEIFNPSLAEQYPNRDWILSRILWLSGTQINYNRLGDVDTMRRYIYIHGTPDHYPMGVPLSDGCIRMRNSDVIELFKNTPVNTKVNIVS